MTTATSIAYPMSITGALLRATGTDRPYVVSAPLSIEQVSLDRPGPGELLIEIEAAGVCHSDLSVINGSRPRPMPMLLGHEAAGVVRDLGDGVDDLEIGQRVVMVFLPRCGECQGCLSGGRTPCAPGSAANAAGTLLSGARRLNIGGESINHHLGVSGFATHAIVDRRSAVPVGDDVPAEVAAVLGCALLTGGGAVLNVNCPTPTDVVAVVGLGGVGMAALLTAKALGVQEIIAIDQVVEKFELATSLGATRTMTPGEAIDSGLRADLVIEAAGHPNAFETAVEITGPGGCMVTVGLPAPGVMARVEPLAITATAKTIVGSYLGSAVPERDIPIFVDMWKEGRLDVASLISSRITLEELNSAMDSLDAGQAVRQVIIFD